MTKRDLRRGSIVGLFDLDGTLVDSQPGVMASLEHAIRGAGLPLPHTGLAARIGPPLDVMVAKLLPDVVPSVLADVVRRFREYYDCTGYMDSAPYPGVGVALREMYDAGVELHILTNKRQGPAEMIVRCHGWAELITSVAGASDGQAIPPVKPMTKPARAAALIEKHALASVVVIGDGADDLATARHIGAAFLLAEWGYGVNDVLAVDPYVSRVRTFADVPLMVSQMRTTAASQVRKP